MPYPRILRDYEYKPDTLLLQWSKRDVWTLKDAFEGTFITGGTGSGKTSGSGALIAGSFLAAGFGGLVLCVKPGERDLWQRYCAKHNRAHHLVVIDEKSEHKMNILNYELFRSSRSAMPQNAVGVLIEILKMTEGDAIIAAESDDYWNRTVKELLSYTITLLFHAWGKVEIPDIMNCVNSAPIGLEQSTSDQWRETSFMYKSYMKLMNNPAYPLDGQDIKAISNYFQYTFGMLDMKPRSSIISTLTSTIHPLLLGDFRKMFATDTTIVPDLCRDGVIILIDLPISEFGEFGKLAQVAFKYIWQNAMLRKEYSDRVNPKIRPVFLWADEAQHIFTDSDVKFQSVCREFRGCSVYLTQSIAGLRHGLGSSASADGVKSILGNFQTKIFHQNSETETQLYAAEQIGKRTHRLYSGGETQNVGIGSRQPLGLGGGLNVGRNESRSYQEHIDWAVRPEEIGRLLQGGKGITEAIILRSGARFTPTDDIWLRTTIRQS